jgi:hypothetical protein
MSVHRKCTINICFSLENRYSKKNGSVGVTRGDFFTLTIATGPIVVVKSGKYMVGKSGKNPVKGLCGVQRVTDILTKTNFLTYLFINNSPW